MADWPWRVLAPYATGPVLTGFLVVALIFTFVLFPRAASWLPENTHSLDRNSWGFSVADAETLLGTISDEQLRAYRRQELYTDMVFPLIYGLGAAIAMVMLTRYPGAPRWLVYVPLLAAVADYVENSSIVVMIGRALQGRSLGAFAMIGSVASRFKHSLLFATVVVLSLLGVIALWRRFR